MVAPPIPDAAAAGLPRDKRPRAAGSFRQYWRLAGGYWAGPTRRQAWVLTLATVALVIANIAVQYGVNKWNAFFFNALEKKQSNIVLSAIALRAPDGTIRERLSETQVRFKRLSSQEIDAYLAGGEWHGKAGGYAIQGSAEGLVAWIAGSHSGVVGLPLFETRALLQAAGFEVR